MIRTRIIGTGSYVPPDILTNDNLSEMVDTSDEWIRTRTGICNRHIAKIWIMLIWHITLQEMQ